MEIDKNTPEYKSAHKKVNELREFYQHLLTFTGIVGGLALFNAFTTGFSQGIWWVQWVIFGWGIGLIGHAVSVFGATNFLGKDWEEKEIQKILEKQK